MLVSICTSKESILSNLVTMVANNGCKFKQIRKYDAQNIKGSDICIIDLDNTKEYHSKIKKDINILEEIIIIGISSSQDILDDFSQYVNTIKKPFNSKHFIEFKNKVKEELKSDYTINKDLDIIYDQLGLKKSDLFNEMSLNNDKLLKSIKKQTRQATSIKSENDFFEELNLNNIAIPKPAIQNFNKPVSKTISIYEDKALEKYRFYKLKRLNLSKMEIDHKLQTLAEARIAEEVAKRRQQTNNSRNDLLEKLKSGNLVNKKPEKKNNTNIKISKENDKNINGLSAEEIYNLNKENNKKEETIKIEKSSLPESKSENNIKPVNNLKENTLKESTENVKIVKKEETIKNLPPKNNLQDINSELYKPNRNINEDVQTVEDKQNTKENTIQNVPVKNNITAPIANTSNIKPELYKTKRPGINEDIQINKKKSYSKLLELEKQKEEEIAKQKTTTILDLNLSSEQENEIKEKLQNLRKYTKAPKPLPKPIQIENEEDLLDDTPSNIQENKKENNTEEEIKNTLADIKNEIKEEVLKIKDEIKEEVVKIKEEVAKTKEEPEEPLTQNQKLYNAIHRLDGSNYANKTTSTNNENENNIKDIKAELPSTSLFDLIKEKNKDIEIIDKKEMRKNEINKIIKPPKR